MTRAFESEMSNEVTSRALHPPWKLVCTEASSFLQITRVATFYCMNTLQSPSHHPGNLQPVDPLTW